MSLPAFRAGTVMRVRRRAVHRIRMSHDPAAVAVGMIPVSFFCNIDRSALSRPAGRTGIVFGIVSVPAVVHLLRGDRADLRIQVDAARVCVIALAVFRYIYPVSASAKPGNARIRMNGLIRQLTTMSTRSPSVMIPDPAKESPARPPSTQVCRQNGSPR